MDNYYLVFEYDFSIVPFLCRQGAHNPRKGKKCMGHL